jgi:hypothetical protein
MVVVKYPEPDFQLKKEGDKEFIFDTIRKKWVVITPEEWVRQNFIRYLVDAKKYPAALIAVEKEIRLGEMNKRFDILVYNNDHKPWMMVECKAMSVQLDESVLQQLLRYHISIPVEYLVITNGSQCYAWRKSEKKLELISELPGLGE